MARQFNQQTVAELEQAGSFCDTLMACAKAREQGKMEWTRHYLSGDYPPHYPVPVTWPVAVKSTGLWFYLVYRYRKWGKTRLA